MGCRKEIIEKNDSSQTKRICAPLLIYDLEIDYLGGNKINVHFNELLPSLNYPLVEYLADIKGVSDGGVAFAFENLLNLLPEIPFELENLNEFLKTLNSFLPSDKIEIAPFDEYQDYTFDNPFESELTSCKHFCNF